MLLACCEVIGTSPAETVMVGDTRYDLEAGLAAGCHTTVHVAHGYGPLPEDLKGRVLSIDHFSRLTPLFGADG